MVKRNEKCTFVRGTWVHAFAPPLGVVDDLLPRQCVHRNRCLFCCCYCWCVRGRIRMHERAGLWRRRQKFPLFLFLFLFFSVSLVVKPQPPELPWLQSLLLWLFRVASYLRSPPRMLSWRCLLSRRLLSRRCQRTRWFCSYSEGPGALSCACAWAPASRGAAVPCVTTRTAATSDARCSQRRATARR